MAEHSPDCPCVVCNPVRCIDCGSTNPYLVAGRCTHRRACEARQMLAYGTDAVTAAAHAQNLSAALEGNQT